MIDHLFIFFSHANETLEKDKVTVLMHSVINITSKYDLGWGVIPYWITMEYYILFLCASFMQYTIW
jgi:hypothetical protein